jgi:hypothetical protein
MRKNLLNYEKFARNLNLSERRKIERAEQNLS